MLPDVAVADLADHVDVWRLSRGPAQRFHEAEGVDATLALGHGALMLDSAQFADRAAAAHGPSNVAASARAA